MQTALQQFRQDSLWFKSNLRNIQKDYEKEFVAVKAGEIVAHNTNLKQLISELKSKKIDPATTLVEYIYQKGVAVLF